MHVEPIDATSVLHRAIHPALFLLALNLLDHEVLHQVNSSAALKTIASTVLRIIELGTLSAYVRTLMQGNCTRATATMSFHDVIGTSHPSNGCGHLNK